MLDKCPCNNRLLTNIWVTNKEVTNFLLTKVIRLGGKCFYDKCLCDKCLGDKCLYDRYLGDKYVGLSKTFLEMSGWQMSTEKNLSKYKSNTSLAAKVAFAHRLQCCTACKIQNGHQGAPKWSTGSGMFISSGCGQSAYVSYTIYTDLNHFVTLSQHDVVFTYIYEYILFLYMIVAQTVNIVTAPLIRYLMFPQPNWIIQSQ